MNPRKLPAAIGATALGVALVLGGNLTGAIDAIAQTATPATEETTDVDAERAQAYDDFVASLATDLGVDATEVDVAIRTALKEQIDVLQAAGELTAEEAAAQKAVIDVTEAPLGLGGHHGRGPGGRFGGRERGDRDGDRDLVPGIEDVGNDDSGVDGEAPGTLPATDDPDAAATPTI